MAPALNGFTSQILQAGLEVNEPVRFVFYLTTGEKIVSGKYSAVLLQVY